MVRPYGKGHKRKRKAEKYDKEDEENDELTLETTEENTVEKSKDAMKDGKEENEDGEETNVVEDVQDQENEMKGIPIVPSDPKTKKHGITFVLEKASLEVAKVGKTYQILNSEDHSNFLRKNHRNPADYRPDIAFQALLTILDSPLNKAGMVHAVYVRTEKGVLFEVKPHVRIPRTYKRFAGIMLQLLQKLSITAKDKREKLLRVIKNPVTQYLPVSSHKIGFSYSSEKLAEMQKYVSTVGDDVDLVFVVGAMAHGKIECDYIDDFIAISGYPLSAAWCISRICEAVSVKWGVL